MLKHLHEWGTPLVHGAKQTGAWLFTDGWKPSRTVLQRGDRITLLGIDENGKQRPFIITGEVKSNHSGQADVHIFPPIMPGRTTNSPADNAAITVKRANEKG